MTPKHTPEPWHLDPTGMTVLDTQGQVIADTAVPSIIGLPDDECKANARLIVKAPDMRSLLESCAVSIEEAADMAADVGNRKGAEQHKQTVDRIYALLARIDGDNQP